MSMLPETINIAGTEYRKVNKAQQVDTWCIQEVRPIYKPKIALLDMRLTMPTMRVRPLDILEVRIIGSSPKPWVK